MRYQVYRDLMGREDGDLRARIATEGWGAAFLALRQANGHWGRHFYQPKWTSTHYTLLDLKNLGIFAQVPEIQETLALIVKTDKGPDGGIHPIGACRKSDICVNGMFLNYAAYFGADEAGLRSVVDFLLAERMPDGGFNCDSNRRETAHSSMHSTISVIEGIREYALNGYCYRLDELLEAEAASREFLLAHRLFRSHRTGEIIDKKMLAFAYPSRWRYDTLRALDYFQLAGLDYRPEMDEAVGLLLKKRRSDGRWALPAKHPGQTHFDMEKAGEPSRWNTLRALRVLKRYR